MYAWLYLKWVPKFSFKFQLQESKKKIASLRPLLDQPLITTKITLNIVKFGVHYYLPNAQINLQSNFNSEKLVKSENLLYGFAKDGIKGGEIFSNIKKFHVHTCLSNGHSNL